MGSPSRPVAAADAARSHFSRRLIKVGLIYLSASSCVSERRWAGEKERAEVAAFEALLAKSIADALVAQLREEATAHGVDVWTWLERQGQEGA